MISETRGGIYAIRNLVTQKKYVGSAICIGKRLKQHTRSLARGKHHSVKLQRAWDKYGASAFEFVVLAIVDEPAMLLTHEQAWIDFLDSAASGYNMTATAGSLLGFKHTTETRQRMSEAHTGLVRSDEHRVNLSIANSGKKMSDEARQKMREAKLGKPRGPHSAEHRARISEAHKGVPLSAEHRAALSRAKTGTSWSPKRRAATHGTAR